MIRNLFINLTITVFSCLIGLFIVNAFLLYSGQAYFPRALNQFQPNIIRTFSPDTYGSDLRRYTAILGDSFVEGTGDAYLTGVYDYSIAHHLHRNDGKNYLIFGRSGFGSISAVSNLFKIYEASRYMNGIEDLGKPERILFCFYEGNDLDNNVKEYELTGSPGESVEVYVARRIAENTSFSFRNRIEATMPATKFLHTVFRRSYRAIRDSQQPNPDASRAGINSMSGPVKVSGIEPLQSAAMELSEEEVGFALQVFLESIRQLQTWSPETEITIVYLPSIVSPYQWQDPVRIYQTFPERGISETTLEANNARSELLRSRIGTFAVQHDLEFVDTTPTIAEIAQEQVLHGPVDWRHFNDAGYRVIADLIAAPRTTN